MWHLVSRWTFAKPNSRFPAHPAQDQQWTLTVARHITAIWRSFTDAESWGFCGSELSYLCLNGNGLMFLCCFHVLLAFSAVGPLSMYMDASPDIYPAAVRHFLHHLQHGSGLLPVSEMPGGQTEMSVVLLILVCFVFSSLTCSWFKPQGIPSCNFVTIVFEILK